MASTLGRNLLQRENHSWNQLRLLNIDLLLRLSLRCYARLPCMAFTDEYVHEDIRGKYNESRSHVSRSVLVNDLC